MSPAPDMNDEAIILNPTTTTAIHNLISSSDELDHPQFTESQIDLG